MLHINGVNHISNSGYTPVLQKQVFEDNLSVDKESCINTITVANKRYLVIDSKYDKLVNVIKKHKRVLNYNVDYSHCLSPKNSDHLKLLNDKVHLQFTHRIHSVITENYFNKIIKIGQPVLTFQNDYISVYRHRTNRLYVSGGHLSQITDCEIVSPGDPNYLEYWNATLIFNINLYKSVVTLAGRDIVFYDWDYMNSPIAGSMNHYLCYWYNQDMLENRITGNNVYVFETYPETYRLYLDYNRSMTRHPICSSGLHRRPNEQNLIYLGKRKTIVPHDETHYLILSDFLDKKKYIFEDNEWLCDLCKLDTYVTIYNGRGINVINPGLQDPNDISVLDKDTEYYECDCKNHLHPILHPKFNVENLTRQCGITSSKPSNQNSRHRSRTNSNPKKELHHRIFDKSGNVVFDGSLDTGGKLAVKVQGNNHNYNAVGYKIAKCTSGYCIVKLGLFQESLIAHEDDGEITFEGKTLTKSVYRSAKFRTNLCLVLGIIPIKFNKHKLNTIDYISTDKSAPRTARSCIYANNFLYTEGDLIYVTDFNSDLSSVCLEGIHFFFDLNIAICMFQYDTVGLSSETRKYIETYLYYTPDDLETQVGYKKLRTEESLDTSSDMPSDNICNLSKEIVSKVVNDSGKIDTSLINETMKNTTKLRLKIVAHFDEFDVGNENCGICREQLKLQEKVIALPCGHIFCLECITDGEWMKKEKMCPICRQKINVEQWPENKNEKDSDMNDDESNIESFEMCMD